MRHFTAFLFAIALVCTADAAHARGGPGNKTFGLGLQLGSPTGIAGKVYFGQVPALTFGAGFAWPFGGFSGYLGADFHVYRFKHKRMDVLTLNLYVGVSLQAGFAGPWYDVYWARRGGVYAYTYINGPFSLAVRGPIGLSIYWAKATFDTFFEVGPALYIVFAAPTYVFVAPTVSVGARYYF